MANKKGVYKGGKPKLSSSQAQDLKERVEKGEHKSKVAAHFNISRETLYQYLRKESSLRESARNYVKN